MWVSRLTGGEAMIVSRIGGPCRLSAAHTLFTAVDDRFHSESAMTTEITARGMRLVAVGALSVALAGCGNCTDSWVDDVEQWARDNPERRGKVGTLRGLEVAQSAGEVADRRVRRGEGPCDIGWRLDEAFHLEFDLQIDVEHPRRDRSWSERGTWKRDDGGRWHLEVDVEFSDGVELSGQRTERVFSDDQGVWEWLGPEAVVRYEPESAAATSREKEYGTRFSGLMTLHGEHWRPSGDGQPESWEHWRPGGTTARACGPMPDYREFEGWGSLLSARSTEHSAQISGGPRDAIDEGQTGRCRRFRADHRLRNGGRMDVEYRECLQESAPETLHRPDVGEATDVRRTRDRHRLMNQFEAWIDEGLIDAEPLDE